MGAVRQSILILMPYFGRWPEWSELFFRSCGFNSSIEWLFLTDCPVPADAPKNVRFVKISFADFCRDACAKLGLKSPITNPYKLCDLRLAFGELFEKEISGYDYFGYGDVDVLFGDLRRFLTPEVLSHDVVSFHDFGLSGFFCLYRNTAEIRGAYKKLGTFEGLMAKPEYARGDEEGILPLLPKERVYLREYYCSPFPLIKWKDGSFEGPKEWYWREGSVRNSFDAEEYMCFHFFAWKSRWNHWRKSKRVVHLDQRAEKEVRINALGFHRGSSKSALYDLRHRIASVGASYRIEGRRLKKGAHDASLGEIMSDIGKQLKRGRAQ